ncbi:hypothetical protein HYW44_00605 [Candidatus Daviesbacteria bacterium]|nr:hypothetical protein [Candidatus Daviesbacteria bacterium]
MNIVYLLKWYLVAASIYLILVGLMYVFDVKLLDAISWPNPALVYAKFIGNLYGEFAILAGLFGIEASRNLEKYRNFLYIVSFWGLFYAAYLIYSSLVTNFSEIFSQTPSIYIWMPFYNYYLFFEAGMLLIFSLLVFLWSKKQTK